MHNIKAFFVVLLALIITGCSYVSGNNGIFVNRNKDYLKATSVEPIKIPPGVSSSTIKNEYPIAKKNYSKDKMVPDLKPPYL